jgi:hypothetical protein
MASRVLLWAAVAMLGPLLGCSSITINAPTGSQVTTPQQVQITTSGYPDNFGVLTISLDGNDLTHFNGGNYQWMSSTMWALSVGSHTMTASGQDSWGINASGSSAFTVTSSALSYACPTGYLHAFTVQCCDGNRCDVSTFTNFGIGFQGNPGCNLLTDKDCINQNGFAVCGASAPYCGIYNHAQTGAVSFVASNTGALSHIQIPATGAVTGSTAFQVWITTDNAGVPGSIVEGPLPLSNIPNFNINQFVVAPLQVFSVSRPTLTAGQTYWLVVAGASNTTTGTWRLSCCDAPNGSNLAVNGNGGASGIPGLRGPWTQVQATDLGLRPAFEIDVR